MKVACLQFAPEVGKVQENIARADSILLEAQLPFDIDWLVLPELAFTGKQPLRRVGPEHVTMDWRVFDEDQYLRSLVHTY